MAGPPDIGSYAELLRAQMGEEPFVGARGCCSLDDVVVAATALSS